MVICFEVEYVLSRPENLVVRDIVRRDSERRLNGMLKTLESCNLMKVVRTELFGDAHEDQV